MYKSKLRLLLIQIVICTFFCIEHGHGKEMDCKILLIKGKQQKICRYVCDENCVDGICDFKPKGCVCKKGYHPEINKCQPDCAAGCPANSTCIEGSNNCRCNEGYTRDSSDQCSPVCTVDCGETRYCDSPNVCACKTGFVEINNVCAPIMHLS
uniref:Tenascin-R n=1 Tax=Bactrocera dorsalis TaxID=27457 RepID=A0A034WAB2_BACDO